MKRLLSIALVAILLLGVVIPAVSVAETKTGVVHGGWLRLRSAASFDASTITSYYTGTVVTILSTTGSWYEVRTPDGRTGYMYSSYVTVTGSGGGSGGGTGTSTVWSGNGYGVRMRSGPGTGYRVLAVYPVGTKVTVLERGSYWSHIQVGSRRGYMMNQFLTGGSMPEPTPGGDATVWSSNGYGVRLRTGPSKSYSIIGVYSVGTPVRVLEKGSVWSYIQIGSRTGYMMTEFLIFNSVSKVVTGVTLNNTTPVVGDVLAVKTLTPAEAKVSYSWLVGGTEQGTAATYTVMPSDVNKTIQLKVTGIDGYTGSATSDATSAVVTATTVTAVTLNLDAGEAPVVGNVLKAATIIPANATVNYVWNVGGVQKSTASTYTVQSADVGKKIELTVKGTGLYSGTSSSGETLPVASTAQVTGVTIYLGSSAITGAPNVGDTLTAVVAPSNATVQYLWTVYNADGTAYRTGNQKDFAITSNDDGKTIKVQVTGISPYNGSFTSSATAAVTNLTRITGVSLVGANAPTYEQGGGAATKIKASVTPSTIASTAVTYNWQVGGVPIIGVTGDEFTVSEQDIGKTVTVTVTGNGTTSTGSATSAASGVVKGVITSVSLSSTSLTVGGTITASIPLSGATAGATLKWFRSGDAGAIGAGDTYTIQAADLGKTISIEVTAGGNYTTKTAAVTASIAVPAVPVVTTYTVTQTLTNMTSDNTSTSVNQGSQFTATFAANTGYALPATITISMGGNTLTAGSDYTYNQSTGAFSISNVTGDIVITATAVATPTLYTVTFNNNGNVTTQQVADGGTVANPGEPTNPLGIGYDFGGWYTDSGFATPASFPHTVTGNITFYAKWTATSVPVTDVTISPSTLIMTVGQTSTLTARDVPTNALNQNVSWSSDDLTVASVDTNGLVTAIGPGTATITVTTDVGSFTAVCDVTVN